VQIVVENKPGAGTMTGSLAVVRAQADGYTLLQNGLALAVNPSLYKSVPYDAAKDFAPVAFLVSLPQIVVVHPSLGVRTLVEFLARYKASDRLTYAHPGAGTMPHLAAELFRVRSGIKMRAVPYRGGAPALTDVIANRVPIIFEVWHSAKRYVVTGDLKLIAGLGAHRLHDEPNVPTVAETFPGFDVVASQAVVGPAGIPKPIVDKIAADIRAVVTSPEFAEKSKHLGIEPTAMTPQELGDWIKAEIARWRDIATKANIKVE
jgi:tripartite-type tricarboxylate transporter receptor subunit TctC